jgi:hypothetical protein
VRYGTIDPDYASRLASWPPERDGPIWMVNFMRYRERADYLDGRRTELSGREADDAYAPLAVLADIGAEVALFGDAHTETGQPHPDWDRVAIVRYPTRRSFREMPMRSDFQALHVHKEAGMEFTIILAATPLTAHAGPRGPGGMVRVTARPADCAPPPPSPESLRFEVEGVAVGDQRRFCALDLSWGDGHGGSPPPGSIVVHLRRPDIDRVREL